MRATFYGFEIAKSGLQAAQIGLDVTGQNMANLSTDGYSRQEMRQSTAAAGTSGTKTAANTKNMAGAGVSLDGIRQIREDFLDLRFRSAAADAGALDKKVAILQDVNAVFDETQLDGLNAMMESFYESLQTVSGHAGDVEFSGIVRSAAQKITKTINQYSNRLETIAQQEMAGLSADVHEINTLLEKINSLNDTIKTESLRGNSTNELFDTRNLHLDTLAGLIRISTESHADGTMTVRAGSSTLLDGQTGAAAKVSVVNGAGGVSLATEDGPLAASGGSVAGAMGAINGKGSYAAPGESTFRGIAYYQSCLDDLARSFLDTFNGLNACQGEEKPLFAGDSAGTIRISDQWLADANFLTASQSGSAAGENDNILRMITAMNDKISISPYFKGSFEEFVVASMLEAGTDLNYNGDIGKTANLVLASVANQRESVMGVSLNEETANLMRYQKAFEAASRFMTALDEALDTIINRMGVVGR